MRAAFYKDNRRLFNKFTEWWDNGIHTHMELVFSDGISASSSFSEGGVRFKKIEFNENKWSFIELPSNLFDEQYARWWFKTNLGRKYDVAGLLRFAADPMKDDRTRFFCSEACLSALDIKEAWRFTPNSAHILLSSIVEAHGA